MGQARAGAAAPRARGARGGLHALRARLPAERGAEAADPPRGRRDLVDVAAAAVRGGAGGAAAGRGGAAGGARAAAGRARGGAGAARGARGAARGGAGGARGGGPGAPGARARPLLTRARHHPPALPVMSSASGRRGAPPEGPDSIFTVLNLFGEYDLRFLLRYCSRMQNGNRCT